MCKKNESKFSMYFGWFVKRMALVLFDILAANLSFYLALLVRFYVNNEFREIAVEKYLPAFMEFSPYYTILCLVVFSLFRLYSNLWKHAGLQDLNRIFIANALTAIMHVAGTLLFICRMPITYYFIGATLQFFLVTASRFSYRLFILESTRIRFLSRTRMNVMIVGIGETARILRSQIEKDSTNVARPVCIFSYNNYTISGNMMNGLPVLSDMKKMPEHLRKYQVKCVILADSTMPMEVRKQIRDVCKKSNIEVQDFSGYLRTDGSALALRTLLEAISEPIGIVINGKIASYASGEEALMNLQGDYCVKKVFVEKGKVIVEMTPTTIILNDVHKEWVRDVEQETGKEISFF